VGTIAVVRRIAPRAVELLQLLLIGLGTLSEGRARDERNDGNGS